MATERTIAYFSMEIGLEAGMPTYSGGLGVLAGDTGRSAADLPENSEWDRTLTHFLYGGDSHYRLCQEAILGIGGVRVLQALGYGGIQRFHMNEGHASLLALELLDEHAAQAGKKSPTHDDVEAVRRQCVFTTHTPVPSGHDQFPMDLVARVLGDHEAFRMKDVFCCEGVLNMTFLALNLSHYVNGVAKKHGEVSRYIAGWREDNFSLRYALNIPKQQVWQAHTAAKCELIQYVNRETNVGMDVDVLTLGFARRAATYKRVDLLFADPGRLREISTKAGALQVVYAGKAHPRDQEGKQLIKRIHEFKESV